MYCKSVNEEDVQVHGAKDELQARNDLARTRRDDTAQTGTGTGPGQDKNKQDKTIGQIGAGQSERTE